MLTQAKSLAHIEGSETLVPSLSLEFSVGCREWEEPRDGGYKASPSPPTSSLPIVIALGHISEQGSASLWFTLLILQ